MADVTTAQEQTHRVLVIDDDTEAVGLVRTWFQDRPFEIDSAPDGLTGLRRAIESQPDLILLDLRMPGMSGIEVARELKTDPRTSTIPVVLATACRDLETKVEAFEAGADDYVTKPIAFEEVDARIRSNLRKRARLVSLESTVRDLHASNERLELLLVLDEKTGLYNFRAFQRRLKEEWQRADRYGGPLSLVFFDLDDFKTVNDTLGHQAGDRVLVEFATLVAGGARANDIAARYGGEEFSVILPHTENEMALRVADRIRRAVQEFTFLEDEQPTRVTVSAGIATYPSFPEIATVEELIRSADRALYRAKDLGKNRVETAGT